MPRISEELLKSVVYLFKGRDAALSGQGEGGTGFLVRIFDGGFEHLYVVTNAHVVRKGGTTLRLNTADGGVEAVEVPPDLWIDHPDSDDVTAAPIEFENPSEWAVTGLYWDHFCPTVHRFQELNIGIGDDVFMLGRFVGHSGRQQNQPLARFGSLAMMDGEKVKDGRGLLVDAYLAEMRSLPGFSGSPVFVAIGAGSYRGTYGPGQEPKMMPFYSETVGLLGIDTGHKRMTHPVLDSATNEPSDPEQLVQQNSGVAIVAPYYKIRDLIEGEVFMAQRKARSKELSEDPEGAVSDMEEGTEASERDRFEDLARKLVKVPKRELDEKRREQEG